MNQYIHMGKYIKRLIFSTIRMHYSTNYLIKLLQ